MAGDESFDDDDGGDDLDLDLDLDLGLTEDAEDEEKIYEDNLDVRRRLEDQLEELRLRKATQEYDFDLD